MKVTTTKLEFLLVNPDYKVRIDNSIKDNKTIDSGAEAHAKSCEIAKCLIFLIPQLQQFTFVLHSHVAP